MFDHPIVVAIVIGVAVPACLAISIAVWKQIKRLARWAWQAAMRQVRSETIDFLFRPNGGSSLPDLSTKLDRVERVVAGELAATNERVDRLIDERTHLVTANDLAHAQLLARLERLENPTGPTPTTEGDHP